MHCVAIIMNEGKDVPPVSVLCRVGRCTGESDAVVK